MMYQAIATIATNKRSFRCESGIWDTAEKANEELRYFIGAAIPMRESFKVIQTIKHITK